MIPILLAGAMLAGCASPTTRETGTPTVEATPTPTCAGGASATRVEFVTPYIEQATPYEADVAGAWLAKEHTFRSWTDMRIVAHRDMAWTGEPGFEVVTVDATNASTTWLLTLRYELVSRCVDDRSADDTRLCRHWGEAANDTRTAFEEAGGWSSFSGNDCRASGGG